MPISLTRTSGRNCSTSSRASAAEAASGDLRLAIGEDAADELAGVGLVVDDEHLEAGEGPVLAESSVASVVLRPDLPGVRPLGVDDGDRQRRR